jgi:paraquat-inducible protein A
MTEEIGHLNWNSLVACPDCDALHVRKVLAAGHKARCVRCGALLYRHPALSADQVLALAVAALLCLLVANTSPIVDLQFGGQRTTATLFGSIVALWDADRNVVAGLVFATALMFPLIDLAAVLALLMVAVRKGPASRFAPLSRLVHALRPWGMVEVFMLGILVSMVKLSQYAHVIPGVALWAFAAATILLTAVTSFDLRSLWRDVDWP